MTSEEIAVRLVRPEEWRQALELANYVFRPLDLERVLPLFFAPDNARHMVVAAAGGRIVSLVSAIRFTVRAGPFVYEAAHVGSVCTDDAWRGKGLATRLLSFQYDLLRSQGVEVVFISGQRGLYLQSGATAAGSMRWFTIPALVDESIAVAPLQPDDWASAAALWAMEPITIVRGPDAWRRGLSAEPDHADWTREAVLIGNPPVAYVVLNHAPDGQGSEVREIAGSRALALRAARHLAARAGSPTVGVPAPAWDHRLNDELAGQDSTVGRWPSEGKHGLLDAVRTLNRLAPDVVPLPASAESYPLPGMYRLLDPLRTVQRHWPELARLDPSLARYEIAPTERGYTLQGDAQGRQGDSAWLCRLLFGAEGTALSPALPIPLPWWCGVTWG